MRELNVVWFIYIQAPEAKFLESWTINSYEN